MSKNYKPKKFSDLIQYLVVQNAQNSLEFYRDAFECEVMNKMWDDDFNLQHIEKK